MPQPPIYAWRAVFGAILATAGIFITATIIGALLTTVFDRLQVPGGAEGGIAGASGITAARLAVFLGAFQIAAATLAVGMARFFGAAGRTPLAAVPIRGGGRALVTYALLLLGLAAAFTAVVSLVAREALRNDLLLFRDVLASDAWWSVALAAVIGAPIAEELVFRGLLYGVLRASPLGQVVGAAVTALAWAGVHAQYSGYGIAGIFLIGLYLAWVREKTGSVFGPMVCHAVYNATVLAILLLAPTRLLEAG